jgi:predicted Fe-S protein YdhL (DUF1289 family)
MALSETMKWMGRSARERAEVMGHQMKDRALTMRLDKASEENERLRTENRTLKETMEESRTDHERILSLLERHRDETETGTEADEGSHKGRWFLFLLLLAGGGWAWMRSRDGSDAMGWGDRPATDDSMGGTGMSSAA